MPRIRNSYSEPYDFCTDCMPTEAEAERKFKFEVAEDANDDRGCCYTYECDGKPAYEETDYCCEECGDRLTDKDE